MRNETIAQFVGQLTRSWFQPPRGMDQRAQDDQAAEMAAAINAALPGKTPIGEIEYALERAKSDLLRNAKSRAWPIIREVVDAVRAGLPQRGEAEPGENIGLATDRAMAWWDKFGDLPGWWNSEAIVRAMIGRGVPPHDLWRAGVDVPREMRTWPAAQRVTEDFA